MAPIKHHARILRAAARAKWNTLLRRLSKHPVTMGSPPLNYEVGYLQTGALENASPFSAP